MSAANPTRKELPARRAGLADEAGAAIELVGRGDVGPLVLFLPGSYSKATGWTGIWGHLPDHWRLAAISLLGCGGTAETRRRGDADMAHESRFVAEAVRRLGGGPVHLVGHSFGGTVALAVALEGKVEVASLALFEANPFDLIAEDELIYSETRALAAAFTAALDDGEIDAAGRIIDWLGGAQTFAGMPPKIRDFCRQTAAANALDWETDFAFRPDPAAFAALTCPVLVARGADAIPAIVATTAALARLLPIAQTEIVPEAGHFLTSTHPGACAALLARHLERATGMGRYDRTGSA